MQMNLTHLINWLTIAIGLAILAMMLGAVFVSIKEGERHAASRACLLAVSLPLPYLVVGLFPFAYQTTIALMLIALTVLAGLVFLIPLGQKRITENDTPQRRIDERDIMFSRYRLEKGSERFEEYYRQNPDKKELDDKFRAKPGLLKKGATYYDPYTFSAAEASFATVVAFHAILDQDSNPQEQFHPDPAKASIFVKRWAKKLGAVSVGITELKDYHLYSHIGRGELYGQPVDLGHKFAIALTVEMDKYTLDRAPFGPTVMESAQQYLASGAIAVQLAEFIRGLGHPARAHIDGNYRVICPLVARDAGLGEIGRMGLLMTPELGPRVRLAVVTTDLPLVTDQRTRSYSMIDFCTRCKKCADACPSKAIPFGDRVEVDGIRRWRINSEACFTFWCTVGTDCARCMRVCPYSHPNNLVHNFIRFGVRNSVLFRVFALKMDNLLYGRKPAPLALPEWMDISCER